MAVDNDSICRNQPTY